MLILALDTTTRAGSVAVTRNDDVLALVEGDGTRTHGERMPGEIAHALRQAGLRAQDLELLVVASGPGAFTGLRIGLAAIQGLAMVLGLPVVGVSALDAIAMSVWPTLEARETSLFVWMDAQRGEVFGAEYMCGAAPHTSGDGPFDSAPDLPWRASDPIVAAPADILAGLDQSRADAVVFAGDGATRYKGIIDTWRPAGSRVLDMPAMLAPSLAYVGRRHAARGAAGSPHTLQPLYVRRPDAELERMRRNDA